jgi:hypothetical protein
MRLDVKRQVLMQVFSNEQICNIHYDVQRHVLLLAKHYATTQMLQEYDPGTSFVCRF